MFHERKNGRFGMTDAEKQQSREWQDKHKRPEPNWREKQVKDQKYWEKHAAEQRRLEELRASSREIPSVETYTPEVPIDPLAHVAPEDREAWRKREEAAKRETAEKMKKVAPLYNKGGLQYVGDDPQLVGSVATGTNRRRS